MTGGRESSQLRALTDLHWDPGAVRTSITAEMLNIRVTHSRPTDTLGGMQP